MLCCGLPIGADASVCDKNARACPSQEKVTFFVSRVLTASYVLGIAAVLSNLLSRICKESAWDAEMSGDMTTQRQWDGYEKIFSFLIYVTTFCLVIQAAGLERECLVCA